VIGWRSVFYITGSLGVIMAIVIFFSVKDAPRGRMEPELAKVKDLETKYKFNWKAVGQIFKSPTMISVVLQGFFGVFPWNVITYFFIGYLQSAERGNYGEGQVMMTMVPAVLALAVGYPLGGWLGDKLFKKTNRGRIIISSIGVILGAIFLYFTLTTPINQPVLFFVLLLITAIFIPFSSPNVVSTIYDITLPEIRSTTNAVESFIESIGAATAPLITGYVIAALQDSGADKPRTIAMLLICLICWVLCFFFYLFAIFTIPKDIKKMHAELERRGLKDGIKEAPRMVG
jgi:MFS family permease